MAKRRDAEFHAFVSHLVLVRMTYYTGLILIFIIDEYACTGP